jgi:hypothetical protein
MTTQRGNTSVLTYHNVDQAIKKLIIESFDDIYLNALSDEIVGYANCTSLQLLTHLLTYYAIIAPTELTQSYKCINAPYDPNQPIETLFQKIQDDGAFAVAGSPVAPQWSSMWHTHWCSTRDFPPMHVGLGNQERLRENVGAV